MQICSTAKRAATQTERQQIKFQRKYDKINIYVTVRYLNQLLAYYY